MVWSIVLALALLWAVKGHNLGNVRYIQSQIKSSQQPIGTVWNHTTQRLKGSRAILDGVGPSVLGRLRPQQCTMQMTVSIQTSASLLHSNNLVEPIASKESFLRKITMWDTSRMPWSQKSDRKTNPFWSIHKNVGTFVDSAAKKLRSPIRSMTMRINRGNGRGKSPRIIGRGNGMLLPLYNQLTLTNILIASNIAVFLLLSLRPRLIKFIIKNNQMIGRGQYHRLLTAAFSHTNLPHIFMNCYSLYSIGPQINSIFGTQRYFLIYLFAGIFANSATYLMGVSAFSLGASGSIYGLLGALGMFYWRNRTILGPRAQQGIDFSFNMSLTQL